MNEGRDGITVSHNSCPVQGGLMTLEKNKNTVIRTGVWSYILSELKGHQRSYISHMKNIPRRLYILALTKISRKLS